MDAIRLATVEEIENIAKEADLMPGCSVVTLGGKEKAVLRQSWAIDPMFFGESTPARKAMFVWGLENYLRLGGVLAYYFTINPADEAWKSTVEKWGAECVSKQPELVYKKVL